MKLVGTFLMQLLSPSMIVSQYKDLITRFATLENPSQNLFEMKTQEIVTEFTEILAKFEEERTNLEKDESDSLHEFNVLSEELETNLNKGLMVEKDRDQMRSLALKEQENAVASLEVARLKQDNDKEHLTDLHASCAKKSVDLENQLGTAVYLQSEASRINSATLSAVAVRVAREPIK